MALLMPVLKATDPGSFRSPIAPTMGSDTSSPPRSLTERKAAGYQAHRLDKQLPPPPPPASHPPKNERAAPESPPPRANRQKYTVRRTTSRRVPQAAQQAQASSRPRTMSSFLPPTATLSPLVTIANRSGTLSVLLMFLSWQDFLPLTQTCRRCRHILRDDALRDAVLTRYVEGYGLCRSRVDAKLKDAMRTVPVTIHDLSLLMISQATPLHVYPTHALSTMSSFLPSLSQHKRSEQLVHLAQAHSRFVLLLQALAHCSSDPPPDEAELESDTSPVAYGESVQRRRESQSLSRYTTSVGSSPHFNSSVRELIFPAPLSHQSSIPRTSRDSGKQSTSPRNSGDASIPKLAPNVRHNSTLSHASSSGSSVVTQASSGSSAASTLGSTRRKRLSIFGGGSNRPLPPPAEPRDLKVYSHSWRQSLAKASSTYSQTVGARGGPVRKGSSHAQFASEGWGSDDDFEPPRKFSTQDSASSNDSFGSASVASSASAGSATPMSSATTSEPMTTSSFTKSPLSQSFSSWYSSPASSPHDLIMASSRVRAPVLRVFVPCSRLYDGNVERCEEQLIDAGLWEHMSVGDIVCNLGFVPPNQGSGTPSPSHGGPEAEEDGGSMPWRGRQRHPMIDDDMSTWLIFDGHVLQPFRPSLFSDIPVNDPLSLPSPFYYEHLAGHTPGSATRVRMILRRLPPAPLRELRKAALMNYAAYVPSQGGLVQVRRWVWTVRVWRGGLDMGIGWEGEWIFEGEGTSEGKIELLSVLSNCERASREWEFVRERSGGRKIWLRLLPRPARPSRSQSPPTTPS